jgi:hypothetical protein
MLAGLPLIGPEGPDRNLPLHPTASPAFWSTANGILRGVSALGNYRTLMDEDMNGYRPNRILLRETSGSSEHWWRLGRDLALAIASYRDRVVYRSDENNLGAEVPFRYAFGRNVPSFPYRATLYGTGPDDNIRGATDTTSGDMIPEHFGLLSLGELANVKGFDSALYGGGPLYAGQSETLDTNRDYLKAVSLLALLDTQFMTTRSNTFTIYMSVTDLDHPESSVRSQVTVDRSNTLPRLTNRNGIPVTVSDTNAMPAIIGQRQIGYFNATYDD